MPTRPVICVGCRIECEDKTEYSVFKCHKGRYALHRVCVEPFFEILVSQRPYEQYDFPPELWLDADGVADGWKSTQP